MTRGQERRDDEADQPLRPAAVEGPVAERGDIRLLGGNVAGHDFHLHQHGSPEADSPRFFVVDKEYLAEEARKAKTVYVARQPEWADVVHGSDTELRFIERDQTEALCTAVREELLAPIARGTDHQLHSLFVLGAPGAGKTTLVRRVAALLAMTGECVIADFGVKTDRVTSAEISSYARALDRLAATGTPVLVLLDDPFFANSGWVDLMRVLGRPQHQRIAVLGASPDFLFQRFAHFAFGKQVLGRTFVVSRPSTGEREQLARLHHRDPSASEEADEDLLVLAMEAATGQSFRDIMQRIWMTLNNGVPVDPTIDIRHLPWPVVAFAVICYFHRNNVLCPESLLHEFLSNTLDETPPALLSHELQEMVTREGWRIFSVHVPSRGQAHGRLIGTTHARVAREAWEYRPRYGLDVETGILDASVRTPAAIPQLAELILAQKPPEPHRLANRFSKRWGTAIEQGTTESKSLCALVRELRSSRAVRLAFRAVLRKRMTARDDQSWLAAWQLCGLSSSAQPQERQSLLETYLPDMLKVADLSAGVQESIEIATRKSGKPRDLVVERLVLSLHEDLGWRPEARQVSWLLSDLPAADAVTLLEPVYAWLEDDYPTDEGYPLQASLVVKALVRLLRVDGLLDEDASTRLLGVVFDWLLSMPRMNQAVLQELIGIAEATPTSESGRSQAILTQLFEWLCTHPDNNETTWGVLFSALGRAPGSADLAGEIVSAAFELLMQLPDKNESAWNALFATLGRLPELSDLAREILPQAFERLKERPENNESAWNALFATLSRNIEFADLASEIMPQGFDRLKKHPELYETGWSALFSTLGRLPGSVELAKEIVPQAFARLMESTESNEITWSVLFSTLGRIPELSSLAREILPLGFNRLKEHPEENESAWSALFSTFGRNPELADLAREILPQGLSWLRGRQESNETAWSTLFTVVVRNPELADLAREILPQGLSWLRGRQESNETAWTALFAALGRNPELADVASEILPLGMAGLQQRPENNEAAWNALLSTLGRGPGLVGLAKQLLPLGLARLKDRTEDNGLVWNTLLTSLGRNPGLAETARDLLPAAFAWLRERPGPDRMAWDGLLIALSHPIDLPTELREQMLAMLHTWYSAHLPADSYQLRSVRLLQLADRADPMLVLALEAELAHLEHVPVSKALQLLMEPVAYVSAKIGHPGLPATLVIPQEGTPPLAG